MGVAEPQKAASAIMECWPSPSPSVNGAPAFNRTPAVNGAPAFNRTPAVNGAPAVLPLPDLHHSLTRPSSHHQLQWHSAHFLLWSSSRVTVRGSTSNSSFWIIPSSSFTNPLLLLNLDSVSPLMPVGPPFLFPSRRRGVFARSDSSQIYLILVGALSFASLSGGIATVVPPWRMKVHRIRARLGLVNGCDGFVKCGSLSDVSLLPMAMSSEVSIEVTDSDMADSAAGLSTVRSCIEDAGCVDGLHGKMVDGLAELDEGLCEPHFSVLSVMTTGMADDLSADASTAGVAHCLQVEDVQVGGQMVSLLPMGSGQKHLCASNTGSLPVNANDHAPAGSDKAQAGRSSWNRNADAAAKQDVGKGNAVPSRSYAAVTVSDMKSDVKLSFVPPVHSNGKKHAVLCVVCRSTVPDECVPTTSLHRASQPTAHVTPGRVGVRGTPLPSSGSGNPLPPSGSGRQPLASQGSARTEVGGGLGGRGRTLDRTGRVSRQRSVPRLRRGTASSRSLSSGLSPPGLGRDTLRSPERVSDGFVMVRTKPPSKRWGRGRGRI
ncbi:hypothetical protein Dimus_037146 [Dionaea muscipula]